MSTSLVNLASLVNAFNPVTPQLRVAAIILRDQQILLVEHRKRGEHYWVLPGGRLQGLETLPAGLRAELTGERSRAPPFRPLLILSEMLAPDRHVVNLMFHAEIGEGVEPRLDRPGPLPARVAKGGGGPAPRRGFP